MKRALLLCPLFALILFISSCTLRFEFAAIQPGEIPADVLSNVESVLYNTANVVWRAVYEQDGHLIVVNTHISTVAGNNWAQWTVF